MTGRSSPSAGRVVDPALRFDTFAEPCPRNGSINSLGPVTLDTFGLRRSHCDLEEEDLLVVLPPKTCELRIPSRRDEIRDRWFSRRNRSMNRHDSIQTVQSPSAGAPSASSTSSAIPENWPVGVRKHSWVMTIAFLIALGVVGALVFSLGHSERTAQANAQPIR
jgi:hypothetical protein